MYLTNYICIHMYKVSHCNHVKLQSIWKALFKILTVVPDNTEKSSASGFSCKFGVLLENNFTGDTYTAIPATEETTKVLI